MIYVLKEDGRKQSEKARLLKEYRKAQQSLIRLDGAFEIIWEIRKERIEKAEKIWQLYLQAKD